jgi:hypothetical protein
MQSVKRVNFAIAAMLVTTAGWVFVHAQTNG